MSCPFCDKDSKHVYNTPGLTKVLYKLAHYPNVFESYRPLYHSHDPNNNGLLPPSAYTAVARLLTTATFLVL